MTTKASERSTLYYGDNLDVLRRHVADDSIDLIYLDPPFNSNATYNVLFAEQDGSRAAAQIKAFEDTWRWDQAAVAAYEEVVEHGGHVAAALRAFRTFIPESNMLAYLSMMAPRLMELQRVLRKTGSIYLHCDPTASHYLKMLMDAIFGAERFRSEIVWQRTNVHSDSKAWSHVSDTIFFYTKTDDFTWNPQYEPLSEQYVESKYTHVEEDGRRYLLDNMTSPSPRPNMMYEWKGHESPPRGWRYSHETMERLDSEGRIWYPADKAKRPRLKRYLEDSKGRLLSNVWTDIYPINSQAVERLGYPTQKPISLLIRIIAASSNEGDVVLDPFCGCGTTISAAHELRRTWIGIDITHLAVNLIKYRLQDEYGPRVNTTYEVIGEPVTTAGAEQLAAQDPYQFQFWALGLVGARPIEEKKGADKGIDGRIYFHDEPPGGKTKQVIISVKAGKTGPEHVRSLQAVVAREDAQIGVLISLRDPTPAMRSEAASSGFYTTRMWGKHPKTQLITVAELLNGKTISMPPAGSAFKAAAPKEDPNSRQQKLDL